jgi:hypothetical protein
MVSIHDFACNWSVRYYKYGPEFGSHNNREDIVIPKRKVADHTKLIKMVQDGIAQADIMKKFGLGTATQLKVAYANALIQSGQAPAIVGGRGLKEKAKAAKAVKVGKRGSIIIPAEMVSELGIGAKDSFTVRKSKSGVAFKKI